MPVVLSEITDLARHQTFTWRVTAAVIKSAVAVGAEAFDGTQYRIMRRALATEVFHDTELWGERFSWGVAGNPVMELGSSDSDIEFTVASLWDAYAGAFAPQVEPLQP
jgi:hypothetical protein